MDLPDDLWIISNPGCGDVGGQGPRNAFTLAHQRSSLSPDTRHLDVLMNDPATVPSTSQRIDKWLWFTRVLKSRTLAAGLVADGKVRLNRVRVEQPSQTVKPRWAS